MEHLLFAIRSSRSRMVAKENLLLLFFFFHFHTDVRSGKQMHQKRWIHKYNSILRIIKSRENISFNICVFGCAFMALPIEFNQWMNKFIILFFRNFRLFRLCNHIIDCFVCTIMHVVPLSAGHNKRQFLNKIKLPITCLWFSLISKGIYPNLWNHV